MSVSSKLTRNDWLVSLLTMNLIGTRLALANSGKKQAMMNWIIYMLHILNDTTITNFFIESYFY